MKRTPRVRRSVSSKKRKDRAKELANLLTIEIAALKSQIALLQDKLHELERRPRIM